MLRDRIVIYLFEDNSQIRRVQSQIFCDLVDGQILIIIIFIDLNPPAITIIRI